MGSLNEAALYRWQAKARCSPMSPATPRGFLFCLLQECASSWFWTCRETGNRGFSGEGWGLKDKSGRLFIKYLLYLFHFVPCVATDNSKNKCLGVPLWHSRLRIWHSHCRGSGHHCGAGSIPGPGTSTCHEHGQKRTKNKNKTNKQKTQNKTLIFQKINA